MKSGAFLKIGLVSLTLGAGALLSIGEDSKETYAKGAASKNKVTFNSKYKQLIKKEEGTASVYIQDKYSIVAKIDVSSLSGFLDTIDENTVFGISFDMSIEPPQTYRAWTNDGIGNLTDSGQNLGDSDTISYDIDLADLDGDGDLDAFIANEEVNKVWTNDGKGTFSDSGQKLGDDVISTYSVALGDLDNDGDVDAVWGNDDYDQVWLNDGKGNFTNSNQNLGTDHEDTYGIALGDMNGDGYLDIITANDGNNRYFRNNADGTAAMTHFQDLTLGDKEVDSNGVAIGDLNGDGRLDIFYSCDGPNQVWLQQTNGFFAYTGQEIGDANTSSSGVVLGDFDGDGHLDAFVSNWGPNKVWLNDGTGTFKDSGQSLGEVDSNGVALGDLDGDGDLDAVTSSEDDNGNEIWLNEKGVFTKKTATLYASECYGVGVGDITGDAKVDVLLGRQGDFEGEEYDGSELIDEELYLSEAEKGVDEDKYNQLKIKAGKGGTAKFVTSEDVSFGDKPKYKKTRTITLKWSSKKLTISVKGSPVLDAEDNCLDLTDDLDTLDEQVGPDKEKKAQLKIDKSAPRKTNCTIVFNNYQWKTNGNDISYTGKLDVKLKYYSEDGDKYDENLGSWNVKGLGELGNPEAVED